MALTIPLPGQQRWWRKHQFVGSPFISARCLDYKFIGEIGEWLVEHGHSAVFIDGIQGGFTISFEDPQVAMLFKLTWL